MILTTSPIPKIVYTLAKVAILAALIGAVADVLLLYNPNGGYETGDYHFLNDVGYPRILLGHHLGIFFIPLSMLGLLHVYNCLKAGGEVLAATVCLGAVYLGFPGVVYHGSVGYIYWIMLRSHDLSNPVHYLIDPLAAFLPIGFLIVSGLFTYMVATRETRYHKWVMFCNPVAFYLVFLISYFVVPPVGNVLLPAGFNLSFMLFFICSLAGEKKVEV